MTKNITVPVPPPIVLPSLVDIVVLLLEVADDLALHTGPRFDALYLDSVARLREWADAYAQEQGGE